MLVVRHTELAESITTGERLVRELRQQVETLRGLSAHERRKVEQLRTEAVRSRAEVVAQSAFLQELGDTAAARQVEIREGEQILQALRGSLQQVLSRRERNGETFDEEEVFDWLIQIAKAPPLT